MSVVLREISPNIRSIRPPRYTALSVRAAQIREELRQGVKKPYTELIDVTWGDPQGAGLKPLTFARQVLAACLYPKLLNNERLPADVRQRAEGLLHECHGGSVGSYTDLPGIPQVARQISEFISRRDGGVPSDPDHILISPGSQWALQNILSVLVRGGGGVRSGVLTPQPSYSLSVMSVVGLGGVPVPYQLWEEQGWEVQVEELNRALESAEGECDPVALYVINPGNPSGHVQRRESIQDVIKFASEKRLFLLADEVYQDCIYKENIEFLSYKRVLAEMGPPFCDTVELASFHSASKGLLGECGFRGGYVELVNMDPAVMKHVFTIFSKDNAPTPGQIALSVMASPPQPGDPSYPLYRTEKQQMQTLIKDNVRKVHEVLNSLPGVSSHPVEGGAFAFPRIDLPPKAIQKAKDLGMEPDIFYCLRLLEDAGLFFTPGCEYGQKDGTYHVRFCIMVTKDTMDDLLTRLAAHHTQFMNDFS
ncbi:alanine aminotransferase 1 [Periophthalmus magnuspinnatus]|uniref:alanine aminotransferase 1 n=1 Tax=Periophthalmus magnuspinnatus TaxID=409849 RepID=UPI00145BE04F|nr:alanine aminotransferase 1 [Periophthalmus magnuspinnatus]